VTRDARRTAETPVVDDQENPAPLEYDDIEQLSMEQFRRFGIACCRRLGCDRDDRRTARALRLLERSLGPPLDDKLRRDAYNAAHSLYLERYRSTGKIDTVSCTLVCACHETPNANLLGNFRVALEDVEGLGREEIARIERQLFREIVGE
jgi:hypothetical protein